MNLQKCGVGGKNARLQDAIITWLWTMRGSIERVRSVLG